LGAIDTAMIAWAPVQDGVNKAKEVVLDAVTSGAAKLVEQLKPVIKKVLQVVQEKLKKDEKEDKEDKKEEGKEKKKNNEIGDHIKNFRFARTDIGKRFYDELIIENAKTSLDFLIANLNDAMEKGLEQKLAGGAKSLLGDKVSLEIVQLIIEAIAEKAIRVVRKFTTIGPLLHCSKTLFDCRADIEKAIKAVRDKGKEAVHKAIEDGSAAMWKTLPQSGLHLFKEMDKLKERVSSEMGAMTQDAIDPLTAVADALYAEQMKALNSVRVQFVNQLKAKHDEGGFGTEDAAISAVRNSFREIVFAVVQVLIVDSWVGIANALLASALAQVLYKFQTDVWPTIQPALAAIQELIPEPVAKMGLKVEPLANKVCNIIITKAVTWALTKLLLKLEQAIFDQSSNL